MGSLQYMASLQQQQMFLSMNNMQSQLSQQQEITERLARLERSLALSSDSPSHYTAFQNPTPASQAAPAQRMHAMGRGSPSTRVLPAYLENYSNLASTSSAPWAGSLDALGHEWDLNAPLSQQAQQLFSSPAVAMDQTAAAGFRSAAAQQAAVSNGYQAQQQQQQRLRHNFNNNQNGFAVHYSPTSVHAMTSPAFPPPSDDKMASANGVGHLPEYLLRPAASVSYDGSDVTQSQTIEAIESENNLERHNRASETSQLAHRLASRFSGPYH